MVDEEKEVQDTYIQDSNVEININSDSSSSKPTGNREDKTDYWPLIIIAVIMVAIALYVFYIKYGGQHTTPS